jgi:hypothetical protein
MLKQRLLAKLNERDDQIAKDRLEVLRLDGVALNFCAVQRSGFQEGSIGRSRSRLTECRWLQRSICRSQELERRRR